MTTIEAAPVFRPTRTFSFATEFRRQASRRRTQLALGFMVVLPLIILVAFQLDSGNDNNNGRRQGQFSSLVNLATAGVALVVGAGDFTLHWGDYSFAGIALGTLAAVLIYQILRVLSPAAAPGPPTAPASDPALR